jgi:hypothetical protein
VNSEAERNHIVDQLGDIKELATDIADRTLTRDDVRDAIAEGLLRAIRHDEFWPALTTGMQRHAQAEAGGWLFGSLKAAMSKAAMFLLLGLLLYLVGGWSALVAFFKSGANA